MKTSLVYNISLLLLFIIETDRVFCEVRAEAEERVGNLKIKTEHDNLRFYPFIISRRF
jgi:hypothetical protein